MQGRVFLGRYEIVRPLGEGSMGKVFLARQKPENKQVVVKLMHDNLVQDPKFRELFEREMQFMARFKHPHVVELLDASTRDPQSLCIVMEYVEGTDMEAQLRKHRKLPVMRIGRFLGQLCSALQAAHSQDVIHRDLKPANMMIVHPECPDESLKVMDFGLAKLSGSVHISLDKLKGFDMTIATGTPEYMAPEQVRGDEIDHRSDLYSVGVILFELLTGRLPFVRPSVMEILEAHADSPPPTFAAVGAAGVVSREVEQVVQRCLCKFPVERPKDAWELGTLFGKALGEKIMEGNSPPPPKAPAPAPAMKKPLDPNAVTYELEAWMPERIAIVKLKGYVDDMRGEVIESTAGSIRVLFGQPNCAYQIPGNKASAKASGGPLAWFGLGGGSASKTKNGLLEMELQMVKTESKIGNVLHITVLLRPERGGALPRSLDWQDLCDRIYKDLRAYLVAK